MIVGYLPLWLFRHSKLSLLYTFLFYFEITFLIVGYIFRKTRAVTIVRRATGCTQNAFTSLGSTVELVEIAREEIGVLSVLSGIEMKVQKMNEMQS